MWQYLDKSELLFVFFFGVFVLPEKYRIQFPANPVAGLTRRMLRKGGECSGGSNFDG